VVSDSGVRLAEWMAVAGMASLGPRARGVMSILLMRDHEDEAALVWCGVDAGGKRRRYSLKSRRGDWPLRRGPRWGGKIATARRVLRLDIEPAASW